MPAEELHQGSSAANPSGTKRSRPNRKGIVRVFVKHAAKLKPLFTGVSDRGRIPKSSHNITDEEERENLDVAPQLSVVNDEDELESEAVSGKTEVNDFQ